MTSNQHGSYILGNTRNTMAGNKGSLSGNTELIPKTGPSSDRGLQFDLVKLESLVIVNQQVTVNTFSGLVHTARHTKGVGNTRKPR